MSDLPTPKSPDEGLHSADYYAAKAVEALLTANDQFPLVDVAQVYATLAVAASIREQGGRQWL